MTGEKINPSGVTAIWGGRGSGKTTLARSFLKQLAAQRIMVIDPMAGEGFTTARDFAQALYDGERRLTLATGDPGEAIPALYAAWAHSTKSAPIYAICDEAPAYLDKPTPGLNRIMFQGRHRAFGMCLIGQRIAAVSAQIRSQAETSFFLRLTDHVDLETARKVIGPENAAKLPQFAPGDYIRHP
ncbi:AAA family ATPase [Tropicibacter alexandrii]|uniref:AAA family ATPase n=1 Tax=Tropicibacter alexandrii TaxID=2267683 RepID=UPI000EF55620|nr:ATP-binding protein [Tropicibacter alexandrii]